MQTKTFFQFTFAAVSAAAAVFACGGGLALPSGATAVATDFGSCDVVDGYAAVSGAYCEGALTCPGAYYAICNGTAWSACACSGAWLKDGTYSKVDKPDLGPAPGGGEGGGGEAGGSEAGGGDGGGTDGGVHIVPLRDTGSFSPEGGVILGTDVMAFPPGDGGAG